MIGMSYERCCLFILSMYIHHVRECPCTLSCLFHTHLRRSFCRFLIFLLLLSRSCSLSLSFSLFPPLFLSLSLSLLGSRV